MNKLYFDTALPMGMRSSAYICQRVTNAISYIMKSKGFNIVNYLDDFAGAEQDKDATRAYNTLGNTLKSCGLIESQEKSVEPQQIMSFLGIRFDTNKLTLEVTEERLLEITDLLMTWNGKHTANRNELESLVGKLMFVTRCVKSSMVFMARMLNTVRSMTRGKDYILDIELKRDLEWWSRFMVSFNGVIMMPFQDWTSPDSIIAVDACLSGIGGICNELNEVFHLELPESITTKNLHINQLEALTVVVALKLWSKVLFRKKVLIYSDNMVTVQVFNTGKAQNSYLQTCLREAAFVLCSEEAELRTIHIAGIENRVTDMLSRWHTKPSFEISFWNEMFKSNKLHVIKQVSIPEGYLHLTDAW